MLVCLSQEQLGYAIKTTIHLGRDTKTSNEMHEHFQYAATLGALFVYMQIHIDLPRHRIHTRCFYYTATTTGLTSLYSNSCMGDVDDDDVDYGLDDLNSDDSTDEEDNPRKPIPQWAQDNKLLAYIKRQEERPLNSSMAIFSGEADPVNLGRIFKRKKQRFFKRTSSAQWGSPPAKANDNDWIV